MAPARFLRGAPPTAWAALGGDPLPWLLDQGQPNLVWRVLVELVGRPPTSPAVLRAQGRAGLARPVATLLKDLLPDGTWATRARTWTRYCGPGWRLVAAVAWGADPRDPRLHAAAQHLLATAQGTGGFAPRAGEAESAPLTARAVQALAELGWCHHSRFKEALAWLEETFENGHGAVTPTALLAALSADGKLRRDRLREKTATTILQALAGNRANHRLGHPNLMRTDLAEMVWVLARAGVAYDRRLGPALATLQSLEDGAGRWSRNQPVPASLALVDEGPGRSQWVTLRAAVGLLAYAEQAGLPRRFPERPGSEPPSN